MTDRELLELAAKAAGIEADSWSDDHQCLFTTHGPYPNEYRKWNPLTDDGDALRLAVKLELHVLVGLAQTPDGDIHVDKDMADPYAATRRAIVRAAAEIGRTKER